MHWCVIECPCGRSAIVPNIDAGLTWLVDHEQEDHDEQTTPLRGTEQSGRGLYASAALVWKPVRRRSSPALPRHGGGTDDEDG